ncbi:MAG: hypothetical protein ACRENB_05620 [Gemmatimonadales bacterium]
MRTAIRYGALACAIALGACSDDLAGPDGLTPLLNADVAQFAADAAGEDLDIMREPVFFMQLPAFGGGGPAFAPGFGDLRPVNCPFNAATGRLECPVISNEHVTITRSYAFWDAANAVQQQYDAQTTAKANTRTDIEGDRSNDDWSASIERHRDMTATGLAGAETQRTWNGSGSSEVARSRHTESGETRSYELSCTLEVDDVVVPVGGQNHWPLSGTITRSCAVTFEGGPRDGQTVERTAVITFNGTQIATLTIGDKTFEVDLANRRRRDR